MRACVSAAVTLPSLVGVALLAGWSRLGPHTPAADQARRGELLKRMMELPLPQDRCVRLHVSGVKCQVLCVYARSSLVS